MTTTSLRTKISNSNYSSEEYRHYVALDWSQENVALGRCTAKNPNAKVIEWPGSDLKVVKEYLTKLTGPILLTVEETTTSHWLYVELKDTVDRMLICDPYRNRLLSEGPKTDKIDAKKLSTLLRSGLLKEVYHSCDGLYELRRLAGAYEDLVKAGVRLKNQRSALYRSVGYRYTKRMSSKLKERISSDALHVYITDWQDRMIDQYALDKACFEQQIAAIVRDNRVMKNLTDLPGIGNLSAFKIYTIVIQAERFKNRGHYLSYCGLVRLEKTSGNKSYGQRMPRFNRRLKAIYKSSARRAIQGGKNPAYDYYKHLTEKGRTHKQATLLVARYLAKVSWGMMKNGQKYDPYRWRKHESIAA
jgi:transposase